MRKNVATKVTGSIVEGIKKSLAEYCKVHPFGDFATLSYDEKVAKFNNLTDLFKSTAIATTCDGYGVEPFIIRSQVGNGSVSFTLRSRLKAEHEFSKKVSYAETKANLLEALCDAFAATIEEYIQDGIAFTNVKLLNERFADIVKKADLSFEVAFALSSNSVDEITNKKLVIGISVEQAIQIGDISLLTYEEGTDDSYLKYCYDLAVEEMTNEIRGIQTPVQFITSKLASLKRLYTFSRKRADKQIRGIVHRKAENLNFVKSGIGYYAEGNTFALVEKTEDGKLNVILSPFNIISNENVECDVIKALTA